MAFVFVVEDGTGLSNATSYVSVEDATDIICVNIHVSAAWEALSVADQEKLVSWASRYLDAHARWKGTKTVPTSALRWPRCGVYDRDNTLIDENTIPEQLKIATAEMARYLITEDRTTERAQDGLESVKADVVEIEFLAGYRLPQIPSHLEYLIQGLGTLSSGTQRFVRITR